MNNIIILFPSFFILEALIATFNDCLDVNFTLGGLALCCFFRGVELFFSFFTALFKQNKQNWE